MLLSASDGPIGLTAPPSGNQVGAVGPDSLLHPLNVDASGNLLASVVGGATATNQTSILTKLTSLLAAAINTVTLGAKTTALSLPVTLPTDQAPLTVLGDAAVAAAAGTGYTSTTGLVTVSGLTTSLLPTAPVVVALFQNPGNSTKKVILDVRTLFSNVSGYFTVTRDPTVTATGNLAMPAIPSLASLTTTPAATLYQGGVTPAVAATGCKVEAVVTIGSLPTDRNLIGGRVILNAGHSLLVTFMPYTLLSYGVTAGAEFEWRES